MIDERQVCMELCIAEVQQGHLGRHRRVGGGGLHPSQQYSRAVDTSVTGEDLYIDE
jgi:hypothetical protein